MLHHCGKGDWNDGDYSGDHELPVHVTGEEEAEYSVLSLEWKAEPSGSCYLLHYSCPDSWIHDESQNIGGDHTDKDRNDLDHALSPDVADDDHSNCEDGYKPVGGTVVDGGRSKVKSDGDDDRSCHNWWEELHHVLASPYLADKSQDKIHETGACYTDAGIDQRYSICHADGASSCLYSCISTKEGKGGSKEYWNLASCNQVHEECCYSCKEKCCTYTKSGENWYQYCCTEHGKHVLKSENQGLSDSKFLGIVDDAVPVFHFSTPFSAGTEKKKVSPSVRLAKTEGNPGFPDSYQSYRSLCTSLKTFFRLES